ncbi:NAD(P)/FAD-dependent oxidoreductase [Tepidimonas charontis]|uniref:Ferredoxin--NADP reductase n=1 Tax=Tepidimonas charontis TaxID=2267262 RepID=A0A554XKN9_9BURK|nr:NAD(P)/FAD-dependent oxidoreductase [Tepidimonas charontis]TSE36393.1 Ferredoxin--NADP reductase [Tepidimonas charontis]
MNAIRTDAIVIGAGPVGLYQAFQLGLQEVRVHVVDALPYAGGQCTALYPTKPIYDLPGIVACDGASLTERLLRQLQPLQVPLHLGQVVTQLQRRADTANGGAAPPGDPRFRLQTSAGLVFECDAIVIAAGAGAFLPRKVPLVDLSPWEGDQVRYDEVSPEVWAGHNVVVLGGTASAAECALQIAEGGAAHVTLVHRTDRFDIDAALDERLQSAIGAGWIRLALGQPIGAIAGDDGRLQALEIATADDQRRAVPLDLLLPRLGLSPQLGPIAEWGLALQRKHLPVDTERFATSEPGIFAVGDVNTYPGKRKLIVCGFHEATLAAFAVAQWLRPNERIVLEYTTTSTRLQRLLGVAR